MLDLRQYSSLGSALRAALERWPDETCLIEADRERENCRLTYRQFKEATLPLARALQDASFHPDGRAAIVMTNQSKWLISAYAILYCGGVLVPLDYKLTAAEHLQLLAHSKAEVLVVEYHLWRAITQEKGFANFKAKTVLVTEAPGGGELHGAKRWEEFRGKSEPVFEERDRMDWASIVYSSGTGGRPKGCVMTHENYLEQCRAITQVFAFEPEARYLSILPTNHVVDFMMGFLLPFTSGATVVHLRTLRPEFVRDAFTRYKIHYMMLVPLILKNLQRGLEDKFATLPKGKRTTLRLLIRLNRALTRDRPRMWLSRRLLGKVHSSFGGQLRAFGVGSAFIEPATLKFFLDLGIPVANSYGLTEAGTAVCVNDPRAPRMDTVGKPLPGTEVRIVNPGPNGIGEVAVRSKTIMSHYLDDPELTAATIVDGWLQTGDLGRLDATGHLQLFGRKTNMIVTEGGKNIYPEDIENNFEGLPVKEFCIFAANYIWPVRKMTGEQLVLVIRLDGAEQFTGELRAQMTGRNRRLPDFKRVSDCLIWTRDFPRTASMKIKRNALAEEIRLTTDRSAMMAL
ncbi:MAG TPA: AMP-binding protein [Candidatus Acidoferrales bacterium]|nr:AMP-binding protein [Candidatus Acidoferrales bacterium]